MRRLILTVATALSLAAPLAMSATGAQADDRRDRWEGRGDRWDRRADRWDRREGRGDGRWDRHDGPRGGYERSWDRGRHNGYYYNDRWFYGPPPQAYYASPRYRPGYAAWRRGAYLPPTYRGYIVSDYERYHLRPPPRGYRWYRVDDDYLLTAIATGLIYDIIDTD